MKPSSVGRAAVAMPVAKSALINSRMEQSSVLMRGKSVALTDAVWVVPLAIVEEIRHALREKNAVKMVTDAALNAMMVYVNHQSQCAKKITICVKIIVVQISAMGSVVIMIQADAVKFVRVLYVI